MSKLDFWTAEVADIIENFTNPEDKDRALRLRERFIERELETEDNEELILGYEKLVIEIHKALEV